MDRKTIFAIVGALFVLILIAGILMFQINKDKNEKKVEQLYNDYDANQAMLEKPVITYVNCDGLLASYSNNSNRANDVTGSLALWAIKCLEFYGSVPENFEVGLMAIKTCIIVKGKPYGDCYQQ